MNNEYRLVSADSHVNEPPDLWTSRLPERFRERAPQVRTFELGDAWVMEGALDPINFGGNCSAGLPVDKRSAWITFEEVRPGGYDPAARIDDQREDGVDAEVLYPTPRIGNQLFFWTRDAEFHLACIRSYNDWLAEFAAHAPERFWGVAMIPNVGADAGVAELERVAALPGIRGVMIGQYPEGGQAPLAADDRFFAAVEGARLPLSIHVAFATEPQGDKRRMKLTGDMRFFDAPIRAGQFINGGIFDRFPSLQLVLAEVDVSWVPYLKEQMDDRFLRNDPAARPQIEHLPSEYFARNISGTFITDKYGVVNRRHIGVSRMMWSSDFPHGGSDWPHSWATIDDHFAGVSATERQQILAGNAIRLYLPR